MRIGSCYTDTDWRRIREAVPPDGSFGANPKLQWAEPINVMRDRLETRFIRPADALVSESTAGFVLLLVDSVVIEFLQRLRTDRLTEERASRDLVTGFLRERPRFQQIFSQAEHDLKSKDCACLACDFYRNARSRITHNGDTHDWLVRYGETSLLSVHDGVRTIDRNRFHCAIKAELEDYYEECLEPDGVALRRTLFTALDRICGIDS